MTYTSTFIHSILKKTDAPSCIAYAKGAPSTPSPPGARRRVHFPHLNVAEEEERSRKGQSLRKLMREEMVRGRKIRHQEHIDQRRAFEVFSSNHIETRERVQNLLRREGAHSIYTRSLQSMLRVLGAPWNNDIHIMLEWFRGSGLQYTKDLRCNYEFIESYLLFLGRAEIFQTLICSHEEQQQQSRQSIATQSLDWVNPFLLSSSKDSSQESHTCSSSVVEQDMKENSIDSSIHDELCYDSVSLHSQNDRTRGRSSRRGFLRRAIKYLWWTLSRRRCVDPLDIGYTAYAVATSVPLSNVAQNETNVELSSLHGRSKSLWSQQDQYLINPLFSAGVYA